VGRVHFIFIIALPRPASSRSHRGQSVQDLDLTESGPNREEIHFRMRMGDNVRPAASPHHHHTLEFSRIPLFLREISSPVRFRREMHGDCALRPTPNGPRVLIVSWPRLSYPLPIPPCISHPLRSISWFCGTWTGD